MVFKPDNNMTRAEFASMIMSYEKTDLSEYENVTLDFTDLRDIPQWAAGAVKAAYSMGIINGRVGDDGTAFAPNDNITRAEVMTILGRLIGNDITVSELTFADNDAIPQWAADGVGKLYTLGVINGYEDNTILPNNNIRRAEAATMMYKFDNR